MARRTGRSDIYRSSMTDNLPRLTATLQHPHIFGPIDSGEVNGTAYYLMPFVEGESLRDRLNREK